MNELTTAPTRVLQVIPKSNATELLRAITSASKDKGVDIEKMERLFAMHREVVKSEAEAAFNGALARAQAQVQPIATNAYNVQTKSSYAKLDAINRAIVPIYTAEGLSLSFDEEEVKEGDKVLPGWVRVIGILSHAQGHSRRYHYDLPLDGKGIKGTDNKTEVHAKGSTTQYGRRYLSCSIFNVSISYDDDDGNAAGRKGPEPDSQGKAVLEACGSLDALKAAWQQLSAEQRTTLGDVMTECRRVIRAADA